MSDNSNQNQNQNQAPVSDDQELAKVLQGMQQENRSMAMSDPADKSKGPQPASGSGMQYEETPKASENKGNSNPAPAKQDNAQSGPPQPSSSQQSASNSSTTASPAPATQNQGTSGSLPTPSAEQAHSAPKAANPGLESLKKEALEELRPLVDKLDLPPKEKFDTMLLIIRSTDDQELLQPAHEAAKAIEDENQRAEALLDIVKEIDYFAGQK